MKRLRLFRPNSCLPNTIVVPLAPVLCFVYILWMISQPDAKSLRSRGAGSHAKTSRNANRANAEAWNEQSLIEGFPASNTLLELGRDTCRMNGFYDKTYHHYNFTQGEDIIRHPNWRRRQKMRQKNRNSTASSLVLPSVFGVLGRNISFVHVGKAGGSSVSCSMRETRKYVWKHCPKTPFPLPGTNESAISLQVNCHTHYNDRLECYRRNRSFIVNTRNPVHRIMSWYIYEHLRNQRIVYPNRMISCGQIVLFTCFDQLEELASLGLSRPNESDLQVGINLTADQCAAWAWAAVQGKIPASYHNTWNYDWYASPLLEDKSNEIFVIRVEHLERDWRVVDMMVGGTGEAIPKYASSLNAAVTKRLPVWNKTVSAAGIRNLCKALCEEIQVYKNLLGRAVNLNEDDLNESIEELRKVCPQETDITTEKCKY